MGVEPRKETALVIEKPTAVFDKSRIACGYLLWGRHDTWKEGKAGFVTAVTDEKLVVQYYPGIGNVTNHFIIPVSEAAKGRWELRWSRDMAEIWEFNGKKNEDNSQKEPEGEDLDDAGGIDL